MRVTYQKEYKGLGIKAFASLQGVSFHQVGFPRKKAKAERSEEVRKGLPFILKRTNVEMGK